MHNFTFYNPVKVCFGKGQISQLETLVPANAKVLIAYGGGSIKKNGVYEQVSLALKTTDIFEFGGIEANPDYDTLMKAVELCRKEKIDLILSVGGGSIIDGCKFIALAVHYQGDAWEILTKKPLQATKAVDLGVVQTLPATGSEMNCGAVISRRSIGAKLSFGHPLVYPKFAILDPETTYTLPVQQLRNGIIDPYIHVTEQYLTTTLNSQIQDGFAEAVLRTLINVGKDIVAGNTDYTLRANWMWAATNALNGIIGVGVDHDWATHMIGHELTACYGLDHAQTLAIVAPQVWRQQKAHKKEKLLKYAKNIWNIDISDEERAIEEAIVRTEEFFHSLGVKTRLKSYDIDANPELIAANVFKFGAGNLGEHKNIDSEAVKDIIQKAS